MLRQSASPQRGERGRALERCTEKPLAAFLSPWFPELGVQMFRPGPNSATLHPMHSPSEGTASSPLNAASGHRRRALMSPGAAALDGMSVLAGRMDGTNKRRSAVPGGACGGARLNNVGSVDLPRAKYVDVQVNGSLLEFKVGSGAELSVVPSRFSEILGRLDVQEDELTDPGG
ncbi:hypothetical protein HPB50_013588 [Hyalomma asiaticum]|uniref:Uncharacterized protein n=1 Tax=Hyalomma asiaticum TaxID=266040 RepID=A0ACB7RWL0_HYAAI|nr:hypothetical protein HPB50_013588 [Hyalomma asiaticum]